MVTFNNKIFKFSLAGIILLLSIWFIREFNLPRVRVLESGAEIRINFIFPMDQKEFNKKISISPEIPATEFDCRVSWESSHSALIRLKEKSEIKGQKVHLVIKNAQTKFPYIKKSASIPIQFQKTPDLIGPSHFKDIPTDEPVIVKFNTPMKRANINKYIESDAEFDVMPVEGGNYCQWRLTPKATLKNKEKYMISFRKGMPAVSGMFLEEDQIIVIETASKPEIVSLIPENDARWIGLYPKIIVESKEAIKSATTTIGGETIQGKILDERWAEFSLPHILEFGTTYNVDTQVISEHGEKSDLYQSKFSTIPLDPERMWIEVILKKDHRIIVYKGDQQIRTMPCSGGTDETPTVLGTYYLEDRGKRFFAKKISEGANNWIRIHGNYLLHGLPRDENWKISLEAEQKIGYPASHGCIRLREIDAQWFYDHIPQNTMIIIHK